MRSPFVYISRHPYRRTTTVCDGMVSLLTVPAGGWMIRTQQQRTCSSPGWSINQAIPFQAARRRTPLHTLLLSLSHRFTRFSFPSSALKNRYPKQFLPVRHTTIRTRLFSLSLSALCHSLQAFPTQPNHGRWNFHLPVLLPIFLSSTSALYGIGTESSRSSSVCIILCRSG